MTDHREKKISIRGGLPFFNDRQYDLGDDYAPVCSGFCFASADQIGDPICQGRFHRRSDSRNSFRRICRTVLVE